MDIIVPDASLILKWVLPPDNERFVAQALAIRDAFVDDEIRLLVPSLWYFEVGNTLARRYPVEAPQLLRHLRSLAFHEAVGRDRYETRALRLTRTYGVTFYDASYHALAEAEDGLFVTADEKYLAKAADAGHLLHLGKWPVR